MDPSSLQQHHQEIMASQSLDSMLVCTKQENQGQQQQDQKKPRPLDEVLKCPRCDSTNTKFCYYNNYSLSQPRYFCKSCRRYWTKGGTLRNVPVGGGCRKNRRSSSSASSSSSSRRSNTPDHHHQQPHIHLITTCTPTPSISSPYDHHHDQHDHHHPLSTNDLTLAFARLQKQVGGSMGFDHHENHGNISHFDLFGNSFIDPQSNGIQHLYYGIGGSGNLGNVENGGGNNVNIRTHHHDHDHHDQMGIMPFDHHNASSGSSTPTEIKHDLGENRVLWGFPWQLSNGDQLGNNYINGGGVISSNDQQLDSLKESWNTGSVLGSSWHSLLNSPLM